MYILFLKLFYRQGNEGILPVACDRWDPMQQNARQPGVSPQLRILAFISSMPNTP